MSVRLYYLDEIVETARKMGKHPRTFATNPESFLFQLLAMMTLLGVSTNADREFMKNFTVGNRYSFPNELTDEWARQVAEIVEKQVLQHMELTKWDEVDE